MLPKEETWVIPYSGEDLGDRPHVAVIYCDQAGAFTVATPLLRGLRERYPGLTLDYLGGEGVRDLEEASPLVDARYSLFGRDDGPELVTQFLKERIAAAGAYDLVISLEADPAAAQACALTDARYVVRAVPDATWPETNPPNEGIDRLTYDVWNRGDLLDDYPELTSQFIAEIYCRIARVETDFGRTEVPVHKPTQATPKLLFATGGRRSRKLWPTAHWLTVADWCTSKGVAAGVLGASPRKQEAEYHSAATDNALVERGVVDLRGQLTLPEVAGALAEAQAFVTIDSALMHIAAAVGTPTVVAFGDGSPRRIWAPPVPSINILTPDDPCALCEENRFKNDDCLLPTHQCMLSVGPDRVIGALEKILSAS